MTIAIRSFCWAAQLARQAGVSQLAADSMTVQPARLQFRWHVFVRLLDRVRYERGEANKRDVEAILQETRFWLLRVRRIGRNKVPRVNLARPRGERIGLTAVAGSAGLILPPASDYGLFARFLQYADSSLLDPGAVRIGAGLDVARQVLKRRGSHTQAVLLISDAAPESAAGELGELALKNAQALNQDHIPPAVLNAWAEAGRDLADLSKLAGGWSASVRDGDRDWLDLYDDGIRSLQSALKLPRNGQARIELFPAVVLLAVAVMVISVLPWRGRSMLLLALAVLPFSTRADSALVQTYSAFRSNDFARAQLLYASEGGYDGRLAKVQARIGERIMLMRRSSLRWLW